MRDGVLCLLPAYKTLGIVVDQEGDEAVAPKAPRHQESLAAANEE